MKKPALIIVNGWNCENFVKDCLKSIIDQTYKEFILVVVDDNSTDNTMKVINETLEGCGLYYYKHKNEKNEGTAKSRLIGQNVASVNFDFDVVIWVDMDDVLKPNAVERVMKEYEDPDCWLTYGNFISKSTLKVCFNESDLNFSDDVHTNNSYRQAQWKYIPLRTHRKNLIDHLTTEDIGNYKAYPDINMLYCMLELAGKEHIRTILEPLYIYNDYHPNTCITRFSFSDREQEKFIAKNTKPKQQLKSL